MPSSETHRGSPRSEALAEKEQPLTMTVNFKTQAKHTGQHHTSTEINKPTAPMTHPHSNNQGEYFVRINV